MDVHEVGRLLFGRPCRLALALWIVRRDKPRFYQSEPPRDVILQSDLAKELGPLWTIIQAAADAFEPP